MVADADGSCFYCGAGYPDYDDHSTADVLVQELNARWLQERLE